MAPENYQRLQLRHATAEGLEQLDDPSGGYFVSSAIDEHSVAGIPREHSANQRIIQVRASPRSCGVWSKRILPLLMVVAAVVAISYMRPNAVGLKTNSMSNTNADKANGNQASTHHVSSIAVKSEEGKEAAESQEAEREGKEEGEKEGEGEEGTSDEHEGEGAEGEGEGEEGEEGGEEEVAWTVTDVQIAGMLMGSCFLVMILFHVVNFPDDDIRFYAWNTISAVVSIFVAVLMFAMFNDAILYQCELRLPTGKNPSVHLCIVQYIHLTVWACMLQFVCAWLSGTILDGGEQNPMQEQYWILSDNLRHDYEKKIHTQFVRNTDHGVTKSYTKPGEISVRKAYPQKEQRCRQVKCWGTLFAHITGFAAINSGGCMQHLETFSSSPGMALIPIVLNQVYINVLFYVFSLLRKGEEAKAKAAGRKGLRAKLFNEEVSEAEIDICCLGWSYLLIQVVRYVLVGEMPTITGEVRTPRRSTIGAQFLIGIVFAVAAVIVIVIKDRMFPKKEKQEGEEEEEEEESPLSRYLEIIIGGLSMCFAWCFLFGGRWLYKTIDLFERNGCSMETVMGRVLLASFICSFVLSFIFVLDKIDDTMGDTIPGGNQVVRQIIMALAVLAGFSWEHAFDGGVEAIADQTDFPLTVTSLLSLAVFIVVVPAWRRHILQKYMILLVLRKEHPVKSSVFDKEPDKLPVEPGRK